MRIYANIEVLNSVVVGLFLSVIATTIAFLWDWQFGIFTALTSGLFLLVYLFFTLRRYKKIADLSVDINKILHGEKEISLARYEEGELSILHNEIYKMNVRLGEQQERLITDKKHLANSIADISHQIRTRLTSINLLLSFLSEPNLEAERRMELTKELFELLTRVDSLISVLLKIAKLDAGTVIFAKESISLETLIKQACEPLLVPIELREQILDVKAVGNFNGDVFWTAEALTNILKNCMEHSPEKGNLSVVATENPIFTEIIISDNGKGIPAEDLPHIFERFYKSKNSGENNAGIGLALARMVITAQNGSIKGENNPKGGARFTIRFYNKREMPPSF